MGFRLSPKARKYFDQITERPGEDASFKLLFDPYYLCLMAGFRYAKIGESKNLDHFEFVDEYPQPYEVRAPIIAGMLIAAEMARKGLQPDDRQSLQGLMLDILDNRSKALLSKQGHAYLDQYALGGIEMIEDAIPKPTDLASFLVDYVRLVQSEATGE